VKPSHVGYFVAILRNGEWSPWVAMIKLDSLGRVTDGQHRLLAIVKTGVTVECLVMRNDNTARITDTGIPRSVADRLSWDGESNAGTLGALVRCAWYWDSGLPYFNGALNSSERQAKPTPGQVDALLAAHPDLRSAATFTVRVKPGCFLLRLRPTIAGFSQYLLNGIDPVECVEFYNGVFTGEELGAGDPRNLLRNLLLRQVAGMARGRMAGFAAPTQLAYLLKGWNLWRSGASRQTLVWKDSEGFPVPAGGEGTWADWTFNRARRESAAGPNLKKAVK